MDKFWLKSKTASCIKMKRLDAVTYHWNWLFNSCQGIKAHMLILNGNVIEGDIQRKGKVPRPECTWQEIHWADRFNSQSGLSLYKSEWTDYPENNNIPHYKNHLRANRLAANNFWNHEPLVNFANFSHKRIKVGLQYFQVCLLCRLVF